MSEFKQGDRVLVEREVACSWPDWTFSLQPQGCSPLPEHVHPHPGVSVGALVEELETRDRLWDGNYSGTPNLRRKAEGRVQELRASREAANQPKPHEVWVRGVQQADGYVGIKTRANTLAWKGTSGEGATLDGLSIKPRAQDIRTDPPQGGE